MLFHCIDHDFFIRPSADRHRWIRLLWLLSRGATWLLRFFLPPLLAPLPPPITQHSRTPRPGFQFSSALSGGFPDDPEAKGCGAAWGGGGGTGLGWGHVISPTQILLLSNLPRRVSALRAPQNKPPHAMRPPPCASVPRPRRALSQC